MSPSVCLRSIVDGDRETLYHCYASTYQHAQADGLLEEAIPQAMLQIIAQVGGSFNIDIEQLMKANPPQRN